MLLKKNLLKQETTDLHAENKSMLNGQKLEKLELLAPVKPTQSKQLSDSLHDASLPKVEEQAAVSNVALALNDLEITKNSDEDFSWVTDPDMRELYQFQRDMCNSSPDVQ